MVKTILRPKSAIRWSNVRQILQYFHSAMTVAVGEDAELGDQVWLSDGATEETNGFYIWHMEALLAVSADTWVAWLTLHVFADTCVLSEAWREDADLFNDPQYRQNPWAMAELYVWDASEMLVISEEPLPHFEDWNPEC